MEYFEPIFQQYYSKSDHKGRKGDISNKNAQIPRKEKEMIEVLLASYLICQNMDN